VFGPSAYRVLSSGASAPFLIERFGNVVEGHGADGDDRVSGAASCAASCEPSGFPPFRRISDPIGDPISPGVTRSGPIRDPIYTKR
jgi:hypothetical protein